MKTWNVSGSGETPTAALSAFAAAVQNDAGAPQDGRLTIAAAALAAGAPDAAPMSISSLGTTNPDGSGGWHVTVNSRP